MSAKRYGIRVMLPPGDPLAGEHLLGSGWEYYRWFEQREARDRAFAQMSERYLYLRRGDDQSQVLAKVER